MKNLSLSLSLFICSIHDWPDGHEDWISMFNCVLKTSERTFARDLQQTRKVTVWYCVVSSSIELIRSRRNLSDDISLCNVERREKESVIELWDKKSKSVGTPVQRAMTAQGVEPFSSSLWSDLSPDERLYIDFYFISEGKYHLTMEWREVAGCIDLSKENKRTRFSTTPCRSHLEIELSEQVANAHFGITTLLYRTIDVCL